MRSGDAAKPKSPGLLLKHYAPKIPMRINAIDLNPGEALLGFSSLRFMGIKGGGAAMSLPESMRRNLSEEGDLHHAAANLFAMLRELDRPEHKGIAVMPIPDTGLGIAINDRLKRAVS
jgi:L-threonylcarbamoyladenylate synthase